MNLGRNDQITMEHIIKLAMLLSILLKVVGAFHILATEDKGYAELKTHQLRQHATTEGNYI